VSDANRRSLDQWSAMVFIGATICSNHGAGWWRLVGGGAVIGGVFMINLRLREVVVRAENAQSASGREEPSSPQTRTGYSTCARTLVDEIGGLGS